MIFLSPSQILKKLYFIYFVLFIIFGIVGITLMPPIQNVVIEIYLWIFSFLFCYQLYKSRPNAITVAIFLFQVISMMLITWINIEYYKEPYGFGADDALSYRSFGEDYGTRDFISFAAALYLLNDIDDFGYPTIVWLCYKASYEYGSWLVIVLNAIVIALGSGRLYQIALRFLPHNYSKLVMVLWGFSVFATTTACEGLKENFMVFVIINYFYYLLQFQDKASIKNTVLTVLFILLTFCFRLATGYSVILCFLVTSILKLKFVRNKIKMLSLIGVGAAVVFLPTVLVLLAGQRGMDPDVFATQSAEKSEAGGGFVVYVMNIISSLIGPFPCFVSKDPEKLNYITRYSLLPTIKMVISFFFYYSLFEIYKKKITTMFPMAIFVLINILMLIIAFFGLHVRFQWPHMPFFFIMSIWGYIKFIDNRGKRKLYVGYLLFVFALIFLYNIR